MSSAWSPDRICSRYKPVSVLVFIFYNLVMEQAYASLHPSPIMCNERKLLNADNNNYSHSSDDMWLVLSEVSGGPFDTLKEFNIEPNSTFDIPVHFKPKTIGKHDVCFKSTLLGYSDFVVVINDRPHYKGPLMHKRSIFKALIKYLLLITPLRKN